MVSCRYSVAKHSIMSTSNHFRKTTKYVHDRTCHNCKRLINVLFFWHLRSIEKITRALFLHKSGVKWQIFIFCDYSGPRLKPHLPKFCILLLLFINGSTNLLECCYGSFISCSLIKLVLESIPICIRQYTCSI